MNPLSALMLLLLGWSPPLTTVPRERLTPPGLTLSEVESRHRLLYKKRPSGLRKACNGFSLDGELISTANHCTEEDYILSETSLTLETIISLPEADISIVADIMEERLRDVPMYRRTLNVGDTVSYFTYFSPVDKERFLLEYPKQVRETPQGLLEITGVIKRADKVREMLDKQCNKYDGRNMYEIAAPGQLGVSGSPVLVKLEDKYFFAGVVVSAGIPGNTFCGFPAYKKSTIIFSGVVNISSLGVVRSEYASK